MNKGRVCTLAPYHFDQDQGNDNQGYKPSLRLYFNGEPIHKHRVNDNFAYIGFVCRKHGGPSSDNSAFQIAYIHERQFFITRLYLHWLAQNTPRPQDTKLTKNAMKILAVHMNLSKTHFRTETGAKNDT